MGVSNLKTTRRISCLALAMLMLLAFVPIETVYAVEPWREAYAQLLRRNMGGQFALYDMDRDGVPELFIENSLYTFDNWIVRRLDENGIPHGYLVEIPTALDIHGFFTTNEFQGAEITWFYSLQNGSLFDQYISIIVSSTIPRDGFQSSIRTIYSIEDNIVTSEIFTAIHHYDENANEFTESTIDPGFYEAEARLNSVPLPFYEITVSNIESVVYNGIWPAPAQFAADILADIHYYGDRSKCQLTPEQALAYAEQIRAVRSYDNDTYISFQALNAFLIDVTGDGFPLLFLITYGYHGADYRLFHFTEGRAEETSQHRDILIYLDDDERILNLRLSYDDYSAEFGTLYHVRNGAIEPFFTYSYQRDNAYERHSDEWINGTQYLIDGRNVDEEEYSERIGPLFEKCEFILTDHHSVQLSPILYNMITTTYTRELVAQIFCDYADALQNPSYTYPQPVIVEVNEPTEVDTDDNTTVGSDEDAPTTDDSNVADSEIIEPEPGEAEPPVVIESSENKENPSSLPQIVIGCVAGLVVIVGVIVFLNRKKLFK